MSVCVTSTALADTPAPVPVDIPEIAIDLVPILYYSAARADFAPNIYAAQKDEIEVYEYETVVCSFYIFPPNDSNMEIVVVSYDWNWGSADTDYQPSYNYGCLDIEIRDIGEACRGRIFVTAKNNYGSAWGHVNIIVHPRS